jgi:hypothetical protein
MRNRIINGAMVIDQRNAGASVTPTNGQYGIDRWVYGLTQASKFTAQQSSDAPAGFSFSNLITSSSAFSIGSSDEFEVFQRIEGFNTADLGFGTANAKTVTLSFWVKSSLTGTFGGSLSNSATNRSYVFSYSISAANTWEQKSVTIAGDTTGTWVGATNGTGLVVLFSLGAGSSRVAAAGAWNGAFNVGVTGQTNLVSTNGATWRITGCQLEVGTQATSFEYRQYGTELALCQRYFVALKYSSGAYLGVAQAILTTAVRGPRIYFPVELRANPTITLPPVSTTNGVSHLASGDQYPTIGSATLNPSSISQLSFSINGDTYGASFTAGNASNLYASGNQVVTASSEL